MRKDADFDVSDRIHIFIEAEENLQDVIQEHQQYIANETLAEEISFSLKADIFQAEFKLGKNMCKVGIERY